MKAARNGWHQFISMQNFHNAIAREEEQEMIPHCQDTGIRRHSLVTPGS